VFEVSDDGGGIDPVKLPQLFQDPFEAKENPDKLPGPGLGLMISKAIVGAHGGTIRAFNNDLGGASFVFTIPFREEGE
jgi:two-component system sensor histidine kinase KdpD